MRSPTSSTTTTLLFFISFAIVCCLLISPVSSSVTGDVVFGNGRGIAVSLLEDDHLLLASPEINRKIMRKEAGNNIANETSKRFYNARRTNLREVGLDGFNLLWLISSKLQSRDGILKLSYSTANESFSKSNTTETEIYLDSTWPRQFLRYNRKPIPISKMVNKNSDLVVPSVVISHISRHLRPEHNLNTIPHKNVDNMNRQTELDMTKSRNELVKINRFIVGNTIGFEMEFRMEPKSGSGYLITGRSLDEKPSIATTNHANSSNSDDDNQSWFGLYAHVRESSYTLRIEYRNAAWNKKSQLQVRLADSFRKGQWQSLAVNIDFSTNSVNYWVNCSVRQPVKVCENISQSSSLHKVYRLLQHKRRGSLPVKVTFRSVIVNNGKNRSTPRQCQHFNNGNLSNQECTGGKIYMACGPSCERTCSGHVTSNDEDDDDLRSCAIACVAGCHCPASMITHNNVCIPFTECPCVIGTKEYKVRSRVTINNELCTCIKSKWKCFALPRFTHTPRNLTITVGRSTQLSCAVSGNPLPVLTWTGPPAANYYVVEKGGGRISYLVLRNITESEDGMYSCRAEVPGGDWEQTATSRIRIYAPPVIKLPRTIPVTRGYPVLSIDCIVTGLPTPSVRWRRNGVTLRSNEHMVIYKTAPGILRLKLFNVQNIDAGEWMCLAYNRITYARRSVRILVRLPEPGRMEFYKRPVDQYVKRGHTAIFNCQILDHQSSNINVTWMKDNKSLVMSGKRIFKKRYRLVVRQVKREDAGTYQCIVTVRRGGRKLRAKADLMIKGQMLPWSEWSPCNATCGRGIKFKRRTCTGVPPNKMTCHGKFIHIKHCNTQVCPGICSAIGDPHYETFDGKRFNFHGDCGYVLSHDATGNEFKILLYNGVCGPRLSCLNRLTAILSITGYAAVVDINRDGTAHVNSIPVELPYVSPCGSLFIAKIGSYTILNAGSDLEIKWALPHRLYLIIGPKYFSRTQGFCGNYNGDPSDDNIIPSGRSVSSDREFGQSWTVLHGILNFSCSDIRVPPRPCERDHLLREKAGATCSFLMNRRVFGACHHNVSVRPFIESCMFDICSTSITRTSTYFCVALEAYAEECLKKKIVLNWRKEYVCERCYGGRIYQQCGPRCVQYCPGVVNQYGKLCVTTGRCISGCHCPEGKVLHKGRCVSPDYCPCIDAGLIFENGTKHNRNCERCVCFNGTWKCVFNQELCDFPSSIIRGPVSQVAPLGYPVTFCCEAVGIPKATVEWYRNGKKIKILSNRDTRDAVFNFGFSKSNSKFPDYGHTKIDLRISNVTAQHAGIYTCKASNELGSHISETAILSVIDPWIATCDPTPAGRIIHLPDGCFVTDSTNKFHKMNVMDVGQCLGIPCFYKSAVVHGNIESRTASTCGRMRQCCMPSVTSPVVVNCNHFTYDTSFIVTVIQKCACAICEERFTVVEGVLKTAITDIPIKHAKVIHQGRVMAYTSDTGSFRILFSSMPEEAHHVTLTFVDVIFKRFPATIKKLPVIPGDITIHSVVINGRLISVRKFNASVGLHHIFRTSSYRNERLRLIIPASSLIRQQDDSMYTGQVQAVLSLISDYERDKRLLQSIPGGFLGINLEGEKRIISPTYILSVSLYDNYGRSVELYPGKRAVFFVTSLSFSRRLLPWVLDELTGLWRERDTRVDIYPRYNKRGSKILLLSAKIPRFSTAWALGDSEQPCYIHARVLNSHNTTVQGVRVVMTSTDEAPALSRPGEPQTNKYEAFFEDLTRVTDTSGLCMPVGCRKFGSLSASKQGNDLVLLKPDTPHPDMGRVAHHSLESRGNHFSETGLSSDDHDGKPIHSHLWHDPEPPISAYFRKEEDCKEFEGGRYTYIFRDESLSSDGGGNVVQATNFQNRIIQTIMIADEESNDETGNRKLKEMICHMKVSVTMSHGHASTRDVPMVIEAITFSGTNVSNQMKMIGWRRETFKMTFRKRTAASRRRPYSRKISEDVCIEYICGNYDTVVYVTARVATDNAVDGREAIRPTCAFVDSMKPNNRAFYKRANYRTQSSELSNGGYILFIPITELRPRKFMRRRLVGRTFHQPHAEHYGFVFTGQSLVESKNKCNLAHGNQYTSATFECS